MGEVSRLQSEIADLTNLLSLITKRGPGLEENDDEPQSSELPQPENDEFTLETRGEVVDEAEFEAPVASGDVEVDAIKRRALDRLAEVLARFKTAKGSRTRGKQNSDAKHVASVVMVEYEDTVTFLCAKNEGIDDVDMGFLRMLGKLLCNVAANGVAEQQAEQVDRAFELIFDHSAPRIKYYTSILRDAIQQAGQDVATPSTLRSRNVLDGLRHATYQDWEDNHGLHFRFQLGGRGEDSVSDKAEDCLSDQEDESLVQDTCSEIRHLFGSAAHQIPQSTLKNLLSKVYRIVRHPRQRPAFKGLLRQMVHNHKRLFKDIWAALLYLTRMFYAAVTFVDLAIRLNVGSFKFQPVTPAAARKPNHSDARIPSQVLASLGYSSLSRGWIDFFQTTERVKEFARLSRSKTAVHGEVQLIFHVEELMQGRKQPAGTVFPYLGCSKKCCFFCEQFRVQHGAFQARGTHQTLFPLWALPRVLPQHSLQLLHGFSDALKSFIRIMLTDPIPPARRDLLQQSSAALSTAQAVQRETPTYTTRPLTSRRMMLGTGGVGVTEHQIEFLPLPQTPGFAMLMGGPGKQETDPVPIDRAEVSKLNHERSIYMLEKIDEMPPTKVLDRKLCRRCQSLAEYRCSACWTLYCSGACQRRNWGSHVFVCRTPNRPNDVDFLRMVIRKVTRDMRSGDEEQIHNAMLYLLADDHICSTFGFKHCKTRLEVLDLVCLYSTILSRTCPAVKSLQEYLATGNLSDFMKQFCQLERHVAQITKKDECACVTWFLERQSSIEPLPIPDSDTASYSIWVNAIADAIDSLDLALRFDNGYKLNEAETDVFHLYVTIQPGVWLVPDAYSSSWIEFGFCHCRSFAQRAELARRYIALARSDATFDDIVAAYEFRSLADLMRTHGIDISELERQGIRLHRPPPCEYAVYRLMIGVEHALSGRYCSCFRVREGRRCHAYFETHIERESDTNFGFHLTSSWERWQLLNFYRHLFRLPGFDPRRMAEAAEDADRGCLEIYLDSLVSNMRMKISDRNRSNLLFPRLKDRLQATTRAGESVSHFHNPCECKVHDVMGPPGISYLNPEQISVYRDPGCQ
ncbi:hypothetical protein JX265_004547 [Neoarthrinium moseri]|uniref:MYND-type domain-containing protein n=1 Tax=Neoarthrinium moseri TaxID=1658444 RepID=A0A9Q0ASI7_9PEZI|nr:hypothetical protein JX265_004547 [Neoarthrinium moseri]